MNQQLNNCSIINKKIKKQPKIPPVNSWEEHQSLKSYPVYYKFHKNVAQYIDEPNSKICNVCGNKYRDKYVVQYHIEHQHLQNPFKCKFPGCKQDFKILRDLKIHIEDEHLDLSHRKLLRESFVRQTPKNKQRKQKKKLPLIQSQIEQQDVQKLMEKGNICQYREIQKFQSSPSSLCKISASNQENSSSDDNMMNQTFNSSNSMFSSELSSYLNLMDTWQINPKVNMAKYRINSLKIQRFKKNSEGIEEEIKDRTELVQTVQINLQ